jgi:hypothetical protein
VIWSSWYDSVVFHGTGTNCNRCAQLPWGRRGPGASRTGAWCRLVCGCQAAAITARTGSAPAAGQQGRPSRPALLHRRTSLDHRAARSGPCGAASASHVHGRFIRDGRAGRPGGRELRVRRRKHYRHAHQAGADDGFGAPSTWTGRCNAGALEITDGGVRTSQCSRNLTYIL